MFEHFFCILQFMFENKTKVFFTQHKVQNLKLDKILVGRGSKVTVTPALAPA